MDRLSVVISELTRPGELVEEEGLSYLADGDAESDEARTLRPLQAAACKMPPEAAFTQTLCADVQSCSLHAAARCAADSASDSSSCAATSPGRPWQRSERPSARCRTTSRPARHSTTWWRRGS